MSQATQALRDWLHEQRAAGHDNESLRLAMLDSGWTSLTINELLGQTESARHPTLCEAPGGRRWVHDRWVDVVLSLQHPLLWVVDGLLSPAECDELINLSRARLHRSETVVDQTGGSQVHVARTSEGMFFQRAEQPVVHLLEQRLATLMSWPIDCGEGLQVLRYGMGAEYRPHHDYFDPQQAGTERICQQGGQRVATVVVYLNTPDAGGDTVFPSAGLRVSPRQGSAVCFVYPQPTPDTLTLHGGAPILAGEKWVATKWLRQRSLT